MRELRDEQTGMVWLSCERLCIADNYMLFNKQDDREVSKLLKEIDSWKHDSIFDYITDQPLGQFFKDNTVLNEELYFGYDKGKLASIIQMTGGNELKNKHIFRSYINECLYNKTEDRPDYIKLSDAIVAEENDNYNNANMYYVITNPRMQGRGIGTRAIMSVNHNLDFFAGEDIKHNTVNAIVHSSNVASQIIFERNGYKKLPVEDGNAFDELYYVVER